MHAHGHALDLLTKPALFSLRQCESAADFAATSCVGDGKAQACSLYVISVAINLAHTKDPPCKLRSPLADESISLLHVLVSAPAGKPPKLRWSCPSVHDRPQTSVGHDGVIWPRRTAQPPTCQTC